MLFFSKTHIIINQKSKIHINDLVEMYTLVNVFPLSHALTIYNCTIFIKVTALKCVYILHSAARLLIKFSRGEFPRNSVHQAKSNNMAPARGRPALSGN